MEWLIGLALGFLAAQFVRVVWRKRDEREAMRRSVLDNERDQGWRD